MTETPGQSAQPPAQAPAAAPTPPAAPGVPAPPAGPVQAAAGQVLAAVNGQPPAAPAAPAAQEQEQQAEPWGIIGTAIVVVVGVAAGVVVLDIMTKGRILGPIFAMFMPKPPPAADQQQATAQHDGQPPADA